MHRHSHAERGQGREKLTNRRGRQPEHMRKHIHTLTTHTETHTYTLIHTYTHTHTHTHRHTHLNNTHTQTHTHKHTHTDTHTCKTELESDGAEGTGEGPYQVRVCAWVCHAQLASSCPGSHTQMGCVCARVSACVLALVGEREQQTYEVVTLS